MSPNEPTPGQPAVSGSPASAGQASPAPVTPSTATKLLAAIGLGMLVVAVGLGVYSAAHSPQAATAGVTPLKKIAPAEVSITSAGFVPASVTVKAGQAVVWTNKDSSPHIVASDPYPADNALAGFNAKQAMSLNDSFSLVFGKDGTYTYHDNLNPYTIKGTVIVKE